MLVGSYRLQGSTEQKMYSKVSLEILFIYQQLVSLMSTLNLRGHRH